MYSYSYRATRTGTWTSNHVTRDLVFISALTTVLATVTHFCSRYTACVTTAPLWICRLILAITVVSTNYQTELLLQYAYRIVDYNKGAGVRPDPRQTIVREFT